MYLFLKFLLIVLNTSMPQVNLNCTYHQYQKHDTNYNFSGEFSLVSKCFQTNSKIVGKLSFVTLNQCFQYATENRALALSFWTTNSPDDQYQHCNIFDCPEMEVTIIDNYKYNDNLTIFTQYFSLFGNFTNIEGSTCIPSIGLFKYHPNAANYSIAKQTCHKSNSYLAHVVTETRTNWLGDLLNTWNPIRPGAYIGLEYQHGNFRSNGVPLQCFTYRAWAANYPKTERNCTILTTDKQWKTTNCRMKFPFICELAASVSDRCFHKSKTVF